MAPTPTLSIRLAEEYRPAIIAAIKFVKVPGNQEKLIRFLEEATIPEEEKPGVFMRLARLEEEMERLREAMQRPVAEVRRLPTQKAAQPVSAPTQATLPPPQEKAATVARVDSTGTFGVKLRAAREAAGLSQNALAKQAGIARSVITEAESGRGEVTQATIEKLEVVLPGVGTW
ncbi:MAG: helix-turn-helix transcriptional regulator [Magnetococcales bacterium]|nr:helix-turn-helix transcriptional regulator [Magnetococcales bacterium]